MQPPSPRQALPCMHARVRGFCCARRSERGRRLRRMRVVVHRLAERFARAEDVGLGQRLLAVARLGEQVAAEEGAGRRRPSAGRSPSRAARAACRTTASCGGRARAARRRPGARRPVGDVADRHHRARSGCTAARPRAPRPATGSASRTRRPRSATGRPQRSRSIGMTEAMASLHQREHLARTGVEQQRLVVRRAGTG